MKMTNIKLTVKSLKKMTLLLIVIFSFVAGAGNNDSCGSALTTPNEVSLYLTVMNSNDEIIFEGSMQEKPVISKKIDTAIDTIVTTLTRFNSYVSFQKDEILVTITNKANHLEPAIVKNKHITINAEGLFGGKSALEDAPVLAHETGHVIIFKLSNLEYEQVDGLANSQKELLFLSLHGGLADYIAYKATGHTIVGGILFEELLHIDPGLARDISSFTSIDESADLVERFDSHSLGHYLAHDLYRIEQAMISKGLQVELLETAVLNQIKSLSNSSSIYNFLAGVLSQLPSFLPENFEFKSVDADSIITEFSIESLKDD